MAALVIAEHEGGTLKGGTPNAVTAASKMGAGDSISTNLVGTIPASLAKGSYKVEVRAKLKAGEKQYSDDNDSVTAGTVHVK